MPASTLNKEIAMTKEAANHHSKAAEHHENAARHHREAGKQHEAGDHAGEAAKLHTEHHGTKSKAANASTNK
jgi:hypothetical protein